MMASTRADQRSRGVRLGIELGMSLIDTAELYDRGTNDDFADVNEQFLPAQLRQPLLIL